VITLYDLLAGGIVAAVLTGIFAAIHILMNKKVRAPSDDLAEKNAAVSERNEVVALYKGELASAKEDIAKMKAQHANDMREVREQLNEQIRKSEEQDGEIDILKSEALANEHYIYRCISTIYRLGTAEDIPKPPPSKIRLITTNTGETPRHG
jgi:septal ring factor EnvC (AmiA/AmiB activator)